MSYLFSTFCDNINPERKRIMKRKILLILLSIFAFTNAASAKDVYYTNDNGVAFTKDEYNFLSFMYWDGSQDLISQTDYDRFIKSDIMNGEIKSNNSANSITPYGVSVSNNDKTLKIVSSCTTNCLISVTATWKITPSVKSYDVIGSLFTNTSLVNTPSTTVKSSIGTSSSGEIKKFNNGFGVSIGLPTKGTSIIVNQTYRVNKGGHIYASYQHAKSTISLANSKNYTLSRAGYGGVFKFSGVATSIYDQMSGVDLAV